MSLIYENSEQLELDNKILGTSTDINNTRFCLAGAPQGITGGLSSDCDYFVFLEDGRYDGMRMKGTGIYSRTHGKVVEPSLALRIKSSRLVPRFGDVCILEYRDKLKPDSPLWRQDGQDFEEYLDGISYKEVEIIVKRMMELNMKFPVKAEQFYNIAAELRREIDEEKKNMESESNIEGEHSHRL